MNADKRGSEEIAKIAKIAEIAEIENLRFFSVSPCLRGEDWVSPIQLLASK